MEEIEKARKEQIDALVSIFSWAGILVMLVGACVYGGLLGVYVYIWFLLPEMIFVTCGVVCNTIDYFKARKKFNKLIEEKVREDLNKYITKTLGLKITTEEKAKILINNLKSVEKLCEHYIKTNKGDEGE